MGYRETYEAWRADPEAFWLAAAEAIDWTRAPSRALDASRAPLYGWFADALGNTCYNAVDRHVEAGHGDRIAIIHDSPVTQTQSWTTYAALLDQVARVAGALAGRGVGRGDRVVIYMPMMPEALVAMLACARLGAVHSVVFGGFAAPELAARIEDARPKAVIAASCGIEPARIVAYKPLLDAAIGLSAHKPEVCIVLQRDALAADLVEGRDVDWREALAAAPADCVDVGGMDPLYLLYTSGTTGQPKGVVRPSAGHMVALAWSMAHIYDIGLGDVFWTASDVGWVVGHSYICYAPLLVGATTVVYEGKPVGTPDAGAFWRVIAEHGVKSFFTAPTAFRAIKREDPDGALLRDHSLSRLKHLFLAGERADPATIAWAERHLKVPVIDHWWQTETGWPITGNPAGLELLSVKPGSSSVPMPGYDVRVLAPNGAEREPGELGAIAIRLPLPPGTLSGLWNAEARFVKSYLTTFPGHYETGDAGFIDADGYVWIMARTDDVINVAGHRLSTGAIEEVLASHADVAECAVVGVADPLKGAVPLGLLCLNKGCERDHESIAAECVALVRDRIGPVAAFRMAVVVERLPKTRSGKILRGVMSSIADGRPWKAPATIDDPAILDEVKERFLRLGFPRQD